MSNSNQNLTQVPEHVQAIVDTALRKFDECTAQQINVINALTTQFEKVLQESRTHVQVSASTTYGRLSSQLERHVDNFESSVIKNTRCKKNFIVITSLLILIALLQIIALINHHQIPVEIKKRDDPAITANTLTTPTSYPETEWKM